MVFPMFIDLFIYLFFSWQTLMTISMIARVIPEMVIAQVQAGSVRLTVPTEFLPGIA